MQYRQDVRHIAHYHNRKNFPTYTRCSENHSIYVRRKSENPRFEIWYFVVVPSGGEEKKVNIGAQLQAIPYKKPPKVFF